jgi:aminoglycoside 6'-N-acetyltransferase I
MAPHASRVVAHALAEHWSRSLGLTELASDSEFRNDLGQRAHLALGFQEVGRIVQYRKSLKGVP